MSEAEQIGAGTKSQTVPPQALFEAAWAALTTGRRQELSHLQGLLERPLETPSTSSHTDAEQLLRLQLLLAATARNLRMLRGQFRLQTF